IVNDSIYAALVESPQNFVTALPFRQQQIEDMAIVFTISRYDRPRNQSFRLQVRKAFEVVAPQPQAAASDGLPLLQLGIEEGSKNLARNERRSKIDPTVFRHFSSFKLSAVGTFFPNDFGARKTSSIVDYQRAAFAGNDVLALMKAKGGEFADRAQWAAVPARK